MIARQIFDKLPALPATITCDPELAGDPVKNRAKRQSLVWSECSARFNLPMTRHEDLQR